MELDELKEKLAAIKEMGFVVSKRRGNTGIGFTLETLLGIAENNVKLPDLGKIELKSKRKAASTPITMFTFNRAVWKIKQLEVIKKYGYFDTTGRQALYCFVGTKPNSQGLFLKIGTDSLQMWQTDETLVAEWQAESLRDTFLKKMPALAAVLAETRVNSEEKEEFFFNEGYLFEKPSTEKLLDLIDAGKIIVDVRMHINLRGSVRNHGTAFRTVEAILFDCFETKTRLL